MGKSNLLTYEVSKEQTHFDESLFEYEEGVDPQKQVYWLTKQITEDLRGKGFTTKQAKEYTNLHASGIFNRAVEASKNIVEIDEGTNVA